MDTKYSIQSIKSLAGNTRLAIHPPKMLRSKLSVRFKDRLLKLSRVIEEPEQIQRVLTFHRTLKSGRKTAGEYRG